ncbi:MAG: DNA polymerase, partial [Treponema sp.]|nr:DNA polymerase [Treponema sp.]
MPEKQALCVIDAYGLIYRSYFAFLSRPLRNGEGKNVSALFGFARAVAGLLDAPFEGGALVVAAFDSGVPTFRHEMYGEYKANREKAPEDLRSQVPLVEEFLAELGVPALRADRYEADDIIAALAGICKKEKRTCYVVSADKDLLQQVGDGVFALRQAKGSWTDSSGAAWETIGAEQVKAEWGIPPEKMLDMLSLCGDASDNIPGVKGIGEKTAAELLARYGTLEEIYKNIASITGAKGKKLAEGKESAFFSRSLVRLESEVPLNISSIEGLFARKIDRPAGARVLLREGMRACARQLDPAFDGKAGGAEPETAGAERADKALLGPGAYETILDVARLREILDEAKARKFVALDFETDSLDAWNSRPVGISLALRPKEAYYAPLAPHGAFEDGSGASDPEHLDPAQARELLAGIFSDPEMTVAAHNAKFDYKVSRGWGLERWKCKIFDTMVAAWLCAPERGNYSLDSLSSGAFGHEALKFADVVPKGRAFDAVSLETATRYSAEDADLCARMARHLSPSLEAQGLSALFSDLEMPLLPILAEMEGAGIQIEADVLAEYGAELERDIARLQDEAWKTAGREFNLASPKQLQEILFVERGLRPGKKTKTGFSTDADSLAELAREDPLPAILLRHRSLAKLKSTYVDSLSKMGGADGRLRTSFDQCGTATGRISSREPNL